MEVIHGIIPDLAAEYGGGDGGYGYGYGDGGDGYGDGYGGYGDGGGGYGYGDGGYGYGDGGYGYGDGYGGYGDGGGGYGYGDGGYGYGDGGYGYGYGGYGDHWQRIFVSAAASWPETQRQRLAEVESSASAIAFWRSRVDGAPANGGSGRFVAEPGLVQEVAGPLELCGSRALHATLTPEKWKGERLWVVALFGDVLYADDKMGALKREIIGEIRLSLPNTQE